MRIVRKDIIEKDIKILKLFFNVYCENMHKNRGRLPVKKAGIIKEYLEDDIELCKECEREFLYSITKRIICPFEPKPPCKKCPSICYSERHRAFMRKMMRFSGKYLILHGRIDLIFKYFF